MHSLASQSRCHVSMLCPYKDLIGSRLCGFGLQGIARYFMPEGGTTAGGWGADGRSDWWCDVAPALGALSTTPVLRFPSLRAVSDERPAEGKIAGRYLTRERTKNGNQPREKKSPCLSALSRSSFFSLFLFSSCSSFVSFASAPRQGHTPRQSSSLPLSLLRVYSWILFSPPSSPGGVFSPSPVLILFASSLLLPTFCVSDLTDKTSRYGPAN